FGFACGGLMHLLADWPNPLGVPWIAGRHSLNLWNSGHCDLIVLSTEIVRKPVDILRTSHASD
ncbi:hypothetical protein DLM46_29425, partial [Paraburkholderia lacunae]